MSSGDYLLRKEGLFNCRVCGKPFRYTNPYINICQNCQLIDYEAMYRKATIDINRLKAENEQLRNDIINSEMNLQIMTDLNKQLKEMLRKCSPWDMLCYDGGGHCRNYCAFCGDLDDHKPNCEYVKIIGGVE